MTAKVSSVFLVVITQIVWSFGSAQITSRSVCNSTSTFKCGDCTRIKVYRQFENSPTSEIYCQNCKGSSNPSDSSKEVNTTDIIMYFQGNQTNGPPPPPPGNNSKTIDISELCVKPSTLGLVLGIVIPVVCCIGIFIGIYFCFCRKKKNQGSVMQSVHPANFHANHQMRTMQYNQVPWYGDNSTAIQYRGGGGIPMGAIQMEAHPPAPNPWMTNSLAPAPQPYKPSIEHYGNQESSLQGIQPIAPQPRTHAGAPPPPLFGITKEQAKM